MGSCLSVADEAYVAVVGCLGLSGLQDQFRLSACVAYMLSFMWSVMDLSGDTLFFFVELRDADTSVSRGPVPLVALQAASLTSIVLSFCLFVWRFAHVNSMNEVDFDLTQKDPVVAFVEDGAADAAGDAADADDADGARSAFARRCAAHFQVWVEHVRGWMDSACRLF